MAVGDGAALLVAASAAGAGLALAGWVREARLARLARRAGTASGPRGDRRFERAATAAVVVIALAGVLVEPVVGVFWAVVGLNHVLGGGEHVPFSRYGMFARAGARALALRFEDTTGERVRAGAFGILPTAAKKRFLTELRAARAAHGEEAARRRAAEVVAEWVERGRPGRGPLAGEPIAVVLVEYRLDGTDIRTTRQVLATTAPR